MILDQILSHKYHEVEVARAAVPLEELHARAADSPPPRGFVQALRERSRSGTAVIAEVKKGSPSKGVIRADFDPVAIARGYEEGGAACLSVLTDSRFFLGDLAFLPAIAEAVQLPLLRKDFVVDSYQIAEARAHRADAVLLIAAALKPEEMADFSACAAGYGLDVLLEVHDEKELALALELPEVLIGINNRNLSTFATDLGVTERLLPHIPPDRLVVSESGLRSRADIERLRRSGASAFLIGETLMREVDFEQKLRELLGTA